MEVEEIQTQGCKFPRISNGNGRIDSSKIGADDEDDCRDAKRHGSVGVGGVGGGSGGIDLSGGGSGGIGRLCGWPSSRIFRVSRASGGKDRHSKVWTSKGLRDRRVRLSVNTAIQFYDLQDRLGYDQPSKAVEWLLKAAAPSISDLPSLNAFPDTQQLSDDKRSSAGTAEPGLGFDSAEVEMDGDPNYLQQQQQHQQHTSLSKSACSSTSETSKGSGLSLSRSESRVKARERARGRAAEKEKEKENDSTRVVHQQNSLLISPNSSFTELLTGGMNTNNNNNNNNNSPSSVHQNAAKSARQWPSSPFDYFTSGLLGPSTTRGNENTPNCYPGQIHLGNSLQPPLTSVSSPMFSITGDHHHHHHHHHPELQHFPFVNEHLVVPVVAAPGGSNGHNNSTNEYNLNFSISSSSSSGFAGFNRGTLQSNSTSSSLLPHSIQRFSPMEGSSQSFFNGGTTAASVDNNNNHHFLSAYDARLQLFYGDGHESRHSSDQKGKGKN